MMRSEYAGAGCVEVLGWLLDKYEAKRVFLVTGGASYEASGAQAALAPYLEGRDVVRFSEFTPNPAADDVEEGVKRLRAHKPHLVLGIGGGSPLDMAKMIKIIPNILLL